MSSDGEELELWPDDFPKSKPTKLVRFSPPPRANKDDVEINYRYVVPRPKSPAQEPKIWLGRTKAEVDEDSKIVAKREAAKHEAEDEEEIVEVVRRRKTTSPSPERYTYEARTSRRLIPNITIFSRRAQDDVGPPPKTAAGPHKPKDDDRFWVVLDDGERVKMKYAHFKDARGHWMPYADNPNHWYYVLH